MSPAARSLSAALVLVVAATAYALLSRHTDRPAPHLPMSVLSTPRPAPRPPSPPTAREILDRAVPLGLGGEQIVRLETLDRHWTREVRELEAAIREAEEEFSGFVKEAGGVRRASLQEVQRRSAEFSRLSAELREHRARHSEAALRVLADWQRGRLAQWRPTVTEQREDR